MFSQKQQVLIFIQLVNMWSVFADYMKTEHRDVQVSRGETIMFTCNVSTINLTMIHWTNVRSTFVYSVSTNSNFSNFSSSRVTIDTNIPTSLSISNIQHDDAGVYTCTITTGNDGQNNMTWNLTITRNQTESSLSTFSFLDNKLYILAAVGFLLCFISAAVCLCSRKCRTRASNNFPVQDPSQSEGELDPQNFFTMTNAPTEPRGSVDKGRNKKKRREYTERLNSLYDHI
uniref:Ig-like domain-containing protein n=2 Tax=Nothobranchius korthausae TaxID=1143690 RepID=A0A1A8ERT9_9TELE